MNNLVLKNRRQQKLLSNKKNFSWELPKFHQNFSLTVDKFVYFLVDGDFANNDIFDIQEQKKEYV